MRSEESCARAGSIGFAFDLRPKSLRRGEIATVPFGNAKELAVLKKTRSPEKA